ncbi:MAG: ATP-binding cassette domain-containing protein [Marinobacter sp.]|uniref:phosphatase domain-containing putative toxin n=1 Tax=Marinobacter sp. TaxID=50741 RepID=UPI00396E300D
MTPGDSADSTPPVLSMRGFGVGFGEKTILASLDLDIPDRQVAILLGPAGTGKSTLLRTLSGYNDASPNLRTWGEATYLGNPISTRERPALVAQNTRMMMSSVLENIIHDLPERQGLSPLQQRQLAVRLLDSAGLSELIERIDDPVVHLDLALQRLLAIMRMAATGSRLLMLDEPTTGLSESEARRLLECIADEGRKRSIIVALHNLEHARQLAGNTILLAGGNIQEVTPIEEFLIKPGTDAGRAFIRSGSCALPDPDTDPESLDPEAPRPAAIPARAKQYVSDSFGPRGFVWLHKGQLAGTPRPGIVQDLEYDLKALRRVGVTNLITLTETPPEVETLKAFGIENIWSPFPDMHPPTKAQALELCEKINQLCSEGGVVAVHCRAGLGRTGTILAAYLIWEGAEALEALEAARRIEPRWVQSEAQAEFLEHFARFLAGRKQAIPVS